MRIQNRLEVSPSLGLIDDGGPVRDAAILSPDSLLLEAKPGCLDLPSHLHGREEGCIRRVAHSFKSIAKSKLIGFRRPDDIEDDQPTRIAEHVSCTRKHECRILEVVQGEPDHDGVEGTGRKR